jgi:hypothetical protein
MIEYHIFSINMWSVGLCLPITLLVDDAVGSTDELNIRRKRLNAAK